MWIIRSPPGKYSMTKHTWSLVWKQPWRLTRKGCREALIISKILFSLMRLQKKKAAVQGDCWHSGPPAGGSNTHLSTSSRVTMSFFFKALMAYSFPVFLNSASNTCAETAATNRMRKTHKNLLGPVTVRSAQPLPSRSVLGPELRCTCNHPSASWGRRRQKSEDKGEERFVFLCSRYEKVCEHVSRCVLESSYRLIFTSFCVVYGL